METLYYNQIISYIMNRTLKCHDVMISYNIKYEFIGPYRSDELGMRRSWDLAT